MVSYENLRWSLSSFLNEGLVTTTFVVVSKASSEMGWGKKYVWPRQLED